MSHISDSINEISYNASQAYMLTKADPSEFIKTAASHSGMNHEMVKRVCEKTNQNIYLKLFEDPSTNRARIEFPMADYEKISSELDTEGSAMKDYNVTPSDFRSSIEKDASATMEKTASAEMSQHDIAQQKNVYMHKVASYRNSVQLLRNSVETLKIASLRDAELALGEMHDISRGMVINGNSLGDITKIACKNVISSGFSHEKVAACLNYIGTALVKEGLAVDTGFTKISSAPADKNHPMNTLAVAYAIAIEKTAGFEEMIAGIDGRISHLNKLADIIESQ